MALCLAQDVVNNAIIDLSTTENKNGSILSGSNSAVSTGAPLPANRKKRKHGNTNGPLQEYDNGGGLGVEVPKNLLVTPISLRIAALEALEALITVVCIFCMKLNMFKTGPEMGSARPLGHGSVG